eukprot:m.383395 g.383395  ORF g.383395 m.383395 type:complete len:103 (+) comp56258_c0_seq27:238-546(+)
MQEYVTMLQTSDYTLCPLGFNAETYRVYEAVSMGSIPIVERATNQTLAGQCDLDSALAPLKHLDAPVVWIDSWTELPALLLEVRASPICPCCFPSFLELDLS